MHKAKKILTIGLIAVFMLSALACAKGQMHTQVVEIGTPMPVWTMPSQTSAPTIPPAFTPRPSEEASESPSELPSESPSAPQTAYPTVEPTTLSDPVTARIMVVGDLMCLSMQQYNAINEARIAGVFEYDFRQSFNYVRELILSADYAIGNLETALSPSWPYATELRETSDGMPNCNGPALYLMAVKYAGIKALALANNHCCDAGVKGIEETVAAVNEYGFRHTGLFLSENEKRYTMLDIKGIKVALLSYSEFYNGKQNCVTEAGRPYMINTYSEAAVKKDVADAKAAGAELIIAYNHWGAEHTHVPTDKVRAHAKQMANAGVDIICGSHSHSMQPVVWLDADDGRKVLCMYSLGNFVSSMGRDTANDTVIVEITVSRGAYGKVGVTDEKYHTCRVLGQFGGKSYVVMPTDSGISSIAAELKAAHERIMAILMSER